MKFFKKQKPEITFIPIIAGMIDDPVIQSQLASTLQLKSMKIGAYLSKPRIDKQ